jgi:dihydrofolate reductase
VIIALLVAMADDGVIGRDNALPWHLPRDLQWFKQLTTGNTIIMGRTTYQSIGRPLPNRRNIVLSRNPAFKAEGVEVVATLEDALELVPNDAEVFVVGGAAVYGLALPRAQRMYLTRVHARVDGDVRFPEWCPDEWRLVWEEAHEADDKHAYPFTFQQFDRIRRPVE